MTSDSVRPVLLAAFLAALVIAAVMDVRARRVPNLLSGALLLLGLAAGALAQFAGSLTSAALGALLGLAIWLPFWMIGMLGAGDVKFYAAACAWIGPSLAWRSSLAVALLGGAMGAVLLARQRGLRSAAEFGAVGLSNARVIIEGAARESTPMAKRTFPYAVPMALVLGVVMFFPQVFR